MSATMSPVPVNWSKKAHLAQVRRAIAREMKHRTLFDLSCSKQYEELLRIEADLITNLGS